MNPNSPDPILSSTYLELDDIGSYSFEFRYRISEPLIIGIIGEYINKINTNAPISLGGIRLDMKEGFRVFPVELTIYYLLPFSTSQFKFLMGGGGGIYIGNEIRSIREASINNVSKKIGYGIQVAVGMDYLVTEYFAVRGQMRFRDPEFQMKSSYNVKSIRYQGRTINLPSNPFDTKVNIDGITFSIGAVFIF